MKDDIAYENQKILNEMEPQIGSRWRHYEGGIYTVVCKSVESNEPHRIFITYKSDLFGYIWSHPLEEWEKLVDVEATIVKRFSPYYDMEKLEDSWDC